jgi:hypothetical protein
MGKLPLMAVAGACALGDAGAAATPAGAVGNPTNASCEGVLASEAGTFAPGTVAFLTHLLQAEAGQAGILNRQFAQSKGTCGI